MKNLSLFLLAKNEKPKDTLAEVRDSIVSNLIQLKVNVGAIIRYKVKFKPTSLIESDIKKLIKESNLVPYDIPNVKYPTNKLSNNGIDMEYYLYTNLDGEKIAVTINITKGEIQLEKA